MELKTKWYVVVSICALMAVVMGAVGAAKVAGVPASEAGMVQGGETIDVKITPARNPNDSPSVDPDSVTVGPNDEVVWSCTTSCDFTVDFSNPDRKPFNNRKFAKGNNRSGRPTGPKGTYKYSVTVGAGVLDPNIILR